MTDPDPHRDPGLDPVLARAPDARYRTPSNLRLRMMASLVMIAVAMGALIVGDVLFWLLAVVASLFMMAEWAVLSGATPREKRTGQFALSVPLALMAPASILIEVRPFFALGVLVGAMFFMLIVTNKRQLSAGIVYCGLPVLALATLRAQPAGLLLALWALSLVWATDIGAFFAGRTIGGPRLAPRISPAKTWSGLIGGIVLATLLATGLHAADGLPLPLVVATPFLAVLAQAGDLFESSLKRRAGVKDSGSVLPGHGGVLDRLDGVVPVAPVAALLVLLTL